MLLLQPHRCRMAFALQTCSPTARLFAFLGDCLVLLTPWFQMLGVFLATVALDMSLRPSLNLRKSFRRMSRETDETLNDISYETVSRETDETLTNSISYCGVDLLLAPHVIAIR